MDRTENLRLSITSAISGLVTPTLTWIHAQDGDTSQSNTAKIDSFANDILNNISSISERIMGWGISTFGSSNNIIVGTHSGNLTDVNRVSKIRPANTSDGFLTLQIDSIKYPVKKVLTDGTITDGLEFGDIKVGVSFFVMFKEEGYFLLLNPLSMDTFYITGENGDIVIIQNDELVSSGSNVEETFNYNNILSGSYLLHTSLQGSFDNEYLFQTAGSAFTLDHDTSASLLYLHVTPRGVSESQIKASSVQSSHLKVNSITGAKLSTEALLEKEAFANRIKELYVPVTGMSGAGTSYPPRFVAPWGWEIKYNRDYMQSSVVARFHLPADAIKINGTEMVYMVPVVSTGGARPWPSFVINSVRYTPDRVTESWARYSMEDYVSFNVMDADPLDYILTKKLSEYPVEQGAVGPVGDGVIYTVRIGLDDAYEDGIFLNGLRVYYLSAWG